ncbi:MAG: GDSL-type esterase/lipase family protein [Gemmatimonadales bacterium]
MHRVRQQDLPFQGSSHQFGSTVADVVHFEDRILLPYRPRLVVFYAGDNDLAMGRTPEQVVGDYRAFIARLRSALPAARVAFVSIKPSPSRRAYIDRVWETNRRIRMEIARRQPAGLSRHLHADARCHRGAAWPKHAWARCDHPLRLPNTLAT